MEEKIYQKLKAGLKNNSLSEITLRAYAQNLTETVPDDAALTDALIAKEIKFLEKMNGQLSKDVADTVKEQLKKAPIPIVAPKPNTPEEENPIADALKRLNVIEAQMKQTQKQQLVASLKTEAEAKLKLKQATNQYILKNALAKVEITDGDTADTLAEKVIPIYDNEFKEAFGAGSQPRTGDTIASKEQGLQRFKEFKEKMEKNNKK